MDSDSDRSCLSSIDDYESLPIEFLNAHAVYSDGRSHRTDEEVSESTEEFIPIDPGPSSSRKRMRNPAPKKKFQMNGKWHFLTFPQCDQSVVFAQAALITNLVGRLSAPLDWFVVVQEAHANNDLHLHVLVAFTEVYRVTNAHFWDFVAQKHGNYKCIGQKKSDKSNIVKYLFKAPLEVECHKTTVEDLTATYVESNEKSTMTGILHDIRQNMSLADLIKKHPGQMLQARRIQEVMDIFQAEHYAESVKSNFFAGLSGPENPTEAQKQIIDWFNSVIIPTERFKSRPIRAKQLWIVAHPGAGKTTFMNMIADVTHAYFLAPEEFQDLWQNETYDIAMIDEFYGQIKATTLNSWLDGGRMQLKRKGVAPRLKTHAVPTLICSNYAPHTCYSDAVPLVTKNALAERCLVVTVSDTDLKELTIAKAPLQ